MNKVELVIKRTNGDVETVDVTKNFSSMKSEFLAKIRKATKDGGKGDVLKAVITRSASNCMDLMKKYNDTNNEGGDGYMPDSDYFMGLKEYKEWIDVIVVK